MSGLDPHADSAEHGLKDAVPAALKGPISAGESQHAQQAKRTLGERFRRRGAGINPGNRFEPTNLHVLGEFVDEQRAEAIGEGADPDEPVRVPLTVYQDKTKTIINRVQQTSDVPMDWTVNPYRGCEHGCVYCFARPYHEYLGFSCGLDFETKIVAKPEAPELLKRELAHPKWRGEPIVMSAITDVYQPIEHKLRLTRACLEVMTECRQPVATMTKSALVLRDIDLWAQLGETNSGRVIVTLVTLDDVLAKALEPRAASPQRRLAVIRKLTEAGVPVAVNIAPVIPGLTDTEIPALLEAVTQAGAKRVAWVMLRLPYQLKAVFLDWLGRSVHPSRAARIESLIRQMRGGKLYDAKSYGGQQTRSRGQGVYADQIKQSFDVFIQRYGLNRDVRPLSQKHFKPPRLDGQMGLFE